jgi:SAM-dependent methyltransferase
MRVLDLIAAELRETWKRPARLTALFSPSRLANGLRFQRVRWLAGGGWNDTKAGTSARQFSSYEDYVRLQQSKLGYLDLAAHEQKFRKALGERLATSSLSCRGARAICLGARLGAEVAAFRDQGAFAIGVDLNPGKDNPWVVFGDFHNLQFADSSVDVMYSNSLDHCFDLARVLAEVRRLLTSDGRLLVEADPGVDDPNGENPDLWATFGWKSIDALVSKITAEGFELVDRADFDYPRQGTGLNFRVGAVPPSP